MLISASPSALPASSSFRRLVVLMIGLAALALCVLATLAGVLGTAVREENILLLARLLATRRIAPGAGMLALSAAAAWMLAVRWRLLADGLPFAVSVGMAWRRPPNNATEGGV